LGTGFVERSTIEQAAALHLTSTLEATELERFGWRFPRSKLSSANRNSFIATEAVEGITGQISEPQETTCELNIWSNLALGESQS
jgi:hypothetical protein